MSIEEYWQSFLKEKGLPEDLRYYEAFAFGMTPEENDELLELVLEGKKRATTSAYLDAESYPHTGDCSIVLDGRGEARCIIRTLKTTVMAFRDMTFDICKKEGEDECLETWQETHRNIFIEEGKELGYEFSEDMRIFFEEFELVHINE
ncbi:MAG: ASCH domain-containing protein [Erysipelotrichaceae bacterium]|nr:ASCH domain-containing protein [Erysipelotrichaceae bacterium]